MTDYSDTLNLTYKVMVRRDAMSDNFRFNFECSACQKSECWVLVREHLSIGVDDYLNEALMIANRTHGWLRIGEGHFCPQCQRVAKVVEEAIAQAEKPYVSITISDLYELPYLHYVACYYCKGCDDEITERMPINHAFVRGAKGDLVVAARTFIKIDLSGWIYIEGEDKILCSECKPVEELTERQPWDAYFFSMARQARSRSTCGRAQIGAVAVTKAKKIVATAYNGVKAGATHCADLPSPVVFANHDVLCEHAEINLTTQLRDLFNSFVMSIGRMDLAIADTESTFRRWVASLEITVYVSGPREVCTYCARKLYEIGIKDVVTDYEEAA